LQGSKREIRFEKTRSGLNKKSIDYAAIPTIKPEKGVYKPFKEDAEADMVMAR
jgi:hypothetical protein